MFLRIIFVIIMFSSIMFSQELRNNENSSSLGIGVLGGLKFKSTDDFFPSILFEAHTSITSYLSVYLSTGYYKYISYNSYQVNTFKYVKIGVDYEKYNAISYSVKNIEYDVIPLKIGLQYKFANQNFSPYSLLDISYNFIDPLPQKTSEIIVLESDSFIDLPSAFKKPHVLQNESISFDLGIGFLYNFNKKFCFNFRYIYCIDMEIDNTHSILIGIMI